jgi:ketosteroid isomerase-like protein
MGNYGARRRLDVTMARMRRILLVAISFAIAVAGQPLPSVTLPPALDRVLRDYEKAWTAKDAAALAGLFAEDGFVLSSGSPMVRGRADIEKHYQGAGGPLYLRAVSFVTKGDLGQIIGGFTHQAGAADSGKFTLTLRRVKGRWLIFSDMDNGNSRR